MMLIVVIVGASNREEGLDLRQAGIEFLNNDHRLREVKLLACLTIMIRDMSPNSTLCQLHAKGPVSYWMVYV